jgi:hypothetical protein
MLNPRLRRWSMSFCLAAALASTIVIGGSSGKAQVIWYLLLFLPVIGLFGEWQFRLGQNAQNRS